uniref:Uncharacterized protein n=1 Tax=Arundo donax TaxID=35708 RepID=A0A0A9BL18_ARUDO
MGVDSDEVTRRRWIKADPVVVAHRR